ncbi:hypothetical protein DPMN_053753 [Dreissena polymorpha]|uniref:Uncharacterized protein n=1 Tax=Dreissena polymorpha TaxID=45954 RepID=A0A9D4CP02_DREPO|nr:hypothetical protein DPMN_053753 [Dreissena polymorpha]
MNIWKEDVALRLGLPLYSLALRTGLGFAGLFPSFLQYPFRIVALLKAWLTCCISEILDLALPKQFLLLTVCVHSDGGS